MMIDARLSKHPLIAPIRPIATASAVLDAADEAGARTLLAPLIRTLGLKVVRTGWRAYDKFGPQSQVWLWWRLEPCLYDAAVIAQIEAVAAEVTPAIDRSAISRRTDVDENDDCFLHEIIVASNCGPIAMPGLVWLDLEIDTQPFVQADLEAALLGIGPEAET